MNLQFNARTINPNQGGGVKLPAGEYPFVITADETDEKGAIWFTLTVPTGHEYAGSTTKKRLGLWSQNTEEYRIAWEQLSAICHVTGVVDLQDTAQLRGIPFYATLTPNNKGAKDEQGNAKYMEIGRFKDTNGRTPNEIAKAIGTAAKSNAPSAPAPVAQAPVPPVYQTAFGVNPNVPHSPAPTAPAGPQVAWPSAPVAPAPAAPAFAHTGAAPAPTPAPWGPPPAAPVAGPTFNAPPQWAK